MAATDLLTLPEAKAALNIPEDDVDNDVELAQVISAATALLEQWVGPVIVRSAVTEYLRGGTATVRPTQTPVYSVTSVTDYDGATATVLTVDTPGSAYNADGFYLDAPVPHVVGVRRRATGCDYPFTAGPGTVKVIYVPGRFATLAAVTPLFKEAATVCLVHLWQHRGANSAFGTAAGDGAPYGGVPFSTDTLRKKVRSMMGAEARGPAIA